MTELRELMDATRAALASEKEILVQSFQRILQTSKSIYDTDRYDWWIDQLEKTDFEELPVTKFGVNEAQRWLEITLSEKDRADLKFRFGDVLHDLCELVFTYCDEDDGCEYQGIYFNYLHIPDQTLFKESEFGNCEPEISIAKWSDVRIARKSELSKPTELFL